jgi:hypothetical protein
MIINNLGQVLLLLLSLLCFTVLLLLLRHLLSQ